MTVNRPQGLSATALLMGITNAMGWFIVDWERPHARFTFVVFTVFILVGYFFIWYYWQGRNWARIAVLLTSLLTLYNLRYWSHGPWMKQIMVISKGVLGSFLLYWLNTARVRTYFKGESSSKA